MNCLASQSDPKRSGNAGPYFKVLNSDSEYGLSLDTRGRECDRVTSRSASSAATVLLVIDVPRSACTTCGTPCTAKICSISSLGQNTGFMGMDVDTDDVAGVDVDHHVRIEVGALHRARELGDVPRIHLPRRSEERLRARLGWVPRQPAAF